MPNRREPFKIKRLAFGSGDPAPPQSLDVDVAKTADFVLERRSGEPYSLNRYFTSAPMTTSAHIRLLEAIETAFSE
jgi:hypothetical protein